MDFKEHLNSATNTPREKLNREMLKFTLELYDNPLLSRKAVDDVIVTFNNFISNLFIPYLQNRMETEVKPVADEESFYKTQFILESSKNMFNTFSTEHRRFKLYEEQSLFIPPEMFVIGEEPYFETEDANTEVKMKPVYATHISLVKTLQAVFQLPGVLKQVEGYVTELSTEDSHVLSSVMQADLWKKEYVGINAGKTVFPLNLYFDDFEVGNPLGSHAGEQKLGGVYASLPCLPPHLNAKLDNVFVSTICHSKHFKTFSNESIFRKTIEDLNVLSKDGIQLDIDGRRLTVYFECLLVLGDNLGLNCICGFVQGFNATYYCRVCSAKNIECKQMIVQNDMLLRTFESYENDLLKNNPVETGVKEECIFNRINHFHITKNISVDVMHDLSEGVAPIVIGKILQVLIDQQVLTLSVINNRIDSFSFNDSEKHNKPRPLYFVQVSGRGQTLKIKQSASEMLCLARYLGLIIGDLIPANNKHWKLYRCLRKIIGVVTSPRLTRGEIFNLRFLIQKHNALYIELFGSLTPKMHFLLHYSMIMLLNGPVTNFSTIMFERKNKKLKEIALGTSCNKNLPLTIAIRHQLQLCYKKEFCASVTGDISQGPIKSHNAYNQLKNVVTNLCVTESVVTLKYVDMLGKVITTGTIIVAGMTAEGPQFGIVKEIFLCKNIYFQIERFDVICFNHFYHAYEVNFNNYQPPVVINAQLIPRLPPCLYVVKKTAKFIATRFDL